MLMCYSNNSVFGGRPCQKVGPARRSALLEGRRVKKEYREHRVYKYMHIYLCTILTIRFLEVGPARRTAGKEGVQGAQSI